MGQLIVSVIATIGVVVFAMDNTHQVQMNAVLAEPVHIRLIFLLTIAFVTGAVATLFTQLLSRIGQRAKLHQQHLWTQAQMESREDMP